MTYVLCDVEECANHDGDGCTLDTVDITRRLILSEQIDGLHRPKRAYCADYDGCEEDWGDDGE